MHRKPMPGQRLLFEPPDLAEILRDIPHWPESALKKAGRAIGAELIRRKRPVPLALEVGEKMYQSAECPAPF